MKILSMEVSNFKGIRSLALDFAGKNAAIYGDNATGKTTIFDAFLWLLYGKDSTGRKDFEIKPLGPDGKPAMHGVEVSVTATIEHECSQVTLRRTYTERWTRRRGDDTEVMSGHETGYYIDGLPMAQGQYQAEVGKMIQEDRIKLLSNPYYFCTQLKWQERRTVLFGLFGGVSDDEVLASDEKYDPLFDAKGRYDVDDYRKLLASQRKATNDALNLLPARIDEARRGIADPVSIEGLQGEINALAAKRDQLMSSLHQADTSALEIELARLESDMKLRQAQDMAQQSDARATWERLRQEQITKLRDKQAAVHDYSGEVYAAKRAVETLEERRKELSTRWHATNDEVDKIDISCPTCKRAYDPESVRAAKESFATAKNARLLSITKDGQEVVSRIKAAQDMLDSLGAQNLASASQRAKYQAEINAVMAQKYEPVPPKYPDMSADYAARCKALQDQIKAIKGASSQDNATTYAMIANVEAQIKTVQAQVSAQERSRAAIQRVQELQTQMRDTAKELERVERLQILCEDFARAKASLVQDGINQHFSLVKFRLFEDQINGGLQETCDPTYNGVPYSDLNRAMQINAGLDIIQALSTQYGQEVPVFVDNAESVVDLYPLSCQVIRLVVSEIDKQLRLQIGA